MSRGGYRPNAGRGVAHVYYINGTKYDSLKVAAETEGVSKVTIHNWCKSDKKPDCYMVPIDGQKPKASQPKKEPKTDQSELPDDIKGEAESAGMSPLDYMLKVMRDPEERSDRRDKMAFWAAPYVHARASGEKGKKQERAEKAKGAAGGKFRPSSPPKLEVAK